LHSAPAGVDSSTLGVHALKLAHSRQYVRHTILRDRKIESWFHRPMLLLQKEKLAEGDEWLSCLNTRRVPCRRVQLQIEGVHPIDRQPPIPQVSPAALSSPAPILLPQPPATTSVSAAKAVSPADRSTIEVFSDLYRFCSSMIREF
jgi:hypothetical protein